MAVECYAFVVFTAPLDEESKEWNKHAKEQGWSGATMDRGEIEYHFCHLRLIQPIGKNGSVPVPKWEIIKDEYTMDDREREELRERTRVLRPVQCMDEDGNVSEKVFWMQDSPSAWKAFLPKVSSIPMSLLFGFYDVIDDRRIQLKQIRFLFLETKTMPLKIALDYVRDRI